MKSFLTQLRLHQNLISKIFTGLLVSLGLVLVFQNCSSPSPSDITVNPNVAPVESGTKSPLVAPNTVKKKLIDGVDVPGFEAGTWIHAFVDDRCVLSREGIIKQTPFSIFWILT